MSQSKFIPSREDQVKEIIRCGRDPSYFTKNYVKIQHATRGTIPFETYPFQDDCMRDFQKHRLNIVLKSRQLGLSTISAAYAVWDAIFHRDRNILVIATKLETAINFIKKVKFMVTSIPKWLLLAKFEDNKRSLRFTNGSSITAIPTSPDAGRSEAISLLLIDECAWIADFDELWVGLSPTISTGGSAILLSTPNGVGGQYHKIWTEAEAGTNDFNAIRLPWHVHPDHNEEWFKKETLNLSKRAIAQEFLCDFVSSGETYLQPDAMEKLRGEIRQPIEKLESNRNVWIWKNPVHDHRYVVSADVARGDSNDFSTFHVIDVNSSEAVVEFKGKITPDKLAELLFDIGMTYNKALVCPENNTFGYTTCARLKEKNYPRLFYSSARGDVFDYSPFDPEELPGFTTHQKSRVQILTNLEELIRNRVISTYSQRLYDELQTFMWHGARAQAAKGYNDDLVMSLAIGAWVGLGRVSGENSSEMAQALLKASGIMSARLETDITSVGPPKTHWSSTSQQTAAREYGKPQDPSRMNHPERSNLNDFSWLLK